MNPEKIINRPHEEIKQKLPIDSSKKIITVPPGLVAGKLLFNKKWIDYAFITIAAAGLIIAILYKAHSVYIAQGSQASPLLNFVFR